MVFRACVGPWAQAKKWPDPALVGRGQASLGSPIDQALFQSAICWVTKVFKPLSLATLASIALYCAR